MAGLRSAAVTVAAELEFVRMNDVLDVTEWYLIDSEWLKRWRDYALRGGSCPGPITNERLLDPRRQRLVPKSNLRPAHDYRGVGEEVWNFFLERYGGGPAITSPVLEIYAVGARIHARQLEVVAPVAVPEVPAVQRAASRSRSGSGQQRRVSKAVKGFWTQLQHHLPLQQRHLGKAATNLESQCDPAAQDPEPVPERPQPRACVICLDQPRTTRLLPCNHCILCVDCANELFRSGGSTSCPTCFRADLHAQAAPEAVLTIEVL
mmetsp:Transcript_19847/g.35931  ORF Transcript_19847/g.35931 Transcript_19847/m.35931 type:complete len:263 (-) Transcript_19847:32-820(-)